MKNKLLWVLVCILLMGCGTTSSTTMNATDGSEIAMSNVFYSKDFLIPEKLKVIAQANLVGKRKAKEMDKATIDLEVIFNNPSEQRLDIQLDLIKYMSGQKSESFFAGPRSLTIVPNSVEKLMLKNLQIDNKDDIKMIFMYSYLGNRRIKEVDMTRLTKEEYKNIK